MREAKRATLSRAEVLALEVVMLKRNRAPGRQTDTGESLEEFGLAVAGNTGDADDLARAKVEADAFDPGDTQAIADFEVACSHLESLHSHDAVSVICKGVKGGFTGDFMDFGSLLC